MNIQLHIHTVLQSLGWFGDQLLLAVEIGAKEEFHVLILEKTESELHVRNSFLGRSQEEMLDILQKRKSLPIIVGINQSQVVEAMVPAKEVEMVQAVLGVEVDDRSSFVYQRLPGTNNQVLGSLSRKTHIESCLEPLATVRDRIIYINMTSASMGFLLPGMNEYEAGRAYHWPEVWQGYLWNQGLEAVNGQEKTKLDSAEIAQAYELQPEELFLMGSGVQYYLSQGNPLVGWEESATNRLRFLKQHRLSKILIMAVPILLILLMLLGGLNLWLDSQNQQARATISQNSATFQTLNQQRKDILEQSQFLQQASQQTLAPSSVSLLLDRLAAVRPAEMRFQTVSVFPTIKEWEKRTGQQGTGQELDLPPVYIQGEAQEAKAITAFAQALTQIDMIQNPKLYETAYDFQNQVHRFTITLHLLQSPR